jgi:glycosyltransferase involved in cell wall biosynthesis
LAIGAQNVIQPHIRKNMRVLLLHNRYQLPGGEDTALHGDIDLLQRFGNTVELFELSNDDITTIGEKARTALTTAYSWRARRAVEDRIRAFNPDVVHVHNGFPKFTPAVYYAAGDLGVPVVQTLHNFRLLCPAATCFRENAPCERCVQMKFPLPGVVLGCYRGSRMGSLALGTMVAAHHFLGTWKRRVHRYIAVSNFVRTKFLQAGFPAERIEVKANCVLDTGVGSGSGGYALFVGRLSPAKGLETLLEAWSTLSSGRELIILGDGPLRDMVKAAAEADSTIRWLGWQDRAVVNCMMKNAAVLVFASEFHETFGMSIVEAFAAGTPVIASDVGALPELMQHGENGLVISPQSPRMLVEALQTILLGVNQPAMRIAARRSYECKHSLEQNYTTLRAIYARARRELLNSGQVVGVADEELIA